MSHNFTLPKKQDIFTVYGAPSCQFCTKAVNLLKEWAVNYVYHNIDHHGQRSQYAQYLRDQNQVPQSHLTIPMIFYYGKFIGGYTELTKLCSNGNLTTTNDF